MRAVPSAPATRAPTILVVEDEASIASAVAARLRSEGYEVHIAPDGPAGVAECERLRPDLVVLDLMLPGLDGLDVCRHIQRDRPVPVLMLTARDSESDLVLGLESGADDYLTKPFSARELVARVRALLRRLERVPETGAGRREKVRIGTFELDLAARRVNRDDDPEPVHLTPTEFDLLGALASQPGHVFTRAELLGQVWGYADDAGARTVDSHVRALRRKLGNDLVRTVHGVGYAARDNETSDAAPRPVASV